MVLLNFFIAGMVATTQLPEGFENAAWGITPQELQEVARVVKVDNTDEYGYSEHLEEDPDVYVRLPDKHERIERIEYYFYQGQLYKVFIIYNRSQYKTSLYSDLVKKMKRIYGPPEKSFFEDVFDLQIQHTLWENITSVLDLRKGAGFIYQVRIDKSSVEQKHRAQKKRKGI